MKGYGLFFVAVGCLLLLQTDEYRTDGGKAMGLLMIVLGVIGLW